MPGRKKNIILLLKNIEECKKRLLKDQDFEAAEAMRDLENLITGIGLTREKKAVVRAFLKLL